jgi:hypothetical protein
MGYQLTCGGLAFSIQELMLQLGDLRCHLSDFAPQLSHFVFEGQMDLQIEVAFSQLSRGLLQNTNRLDDPFSHKPQSEYAKSCSHATAQDENSDDPPLSFGRGENACLAACSQGFDSFREESIERIERLIQQYGGRLVWTVPGFWAWFCDLVGFPHRADDLFPERTQRFG